ncbi:MAG TPA: glycosyltransferase [Gemmatirosa sp.]
MRTSAPCILTVALEDYYHNFERVIQRAHWPRFETRVEQSTLRALDLLDEFGIRATFFTLGWIANTMPEVLAEVARRGHEIASKGYNQRSLRELSASEFRDDLARSRDAIERASGQRVLGYRAPGWLTATDLWALEVLANEGYLYDSSVKPIFLSPRPELAHRFAHRRQLGDRTLWEFPISTVGIGRALLPVGAANYFRQLPQPVVARAVAHWHDRYPGAPFTMYFHTWELDPGQPQITAAPLLNRVRKYRNLDRVPAILAHYFSRYSFSGIRDYLGVAATAPVAPEDELTRWAPRHDDRDERRLPIALAPAARGAPQRITLAVPCYNEEHSLPYLANTLKDVERLLAARYELEYVFVDDCSVDGTWSLLHHLFGENPRCRLLRHDVNRGVAASISMGIRSAKTDVVCSIDCDCTYDPHDLARMVPLMTDGVDLVTASPYHPDGRVHNVPRWRVSLSKTLSRMYRVVLRQPLHTYTSCFRVYRRSSVVRIEPTRGGFLGIAELIGELALSGAVIVECPATLEVRVLGHSKMKVLRTIVGHLGLIASFARKRVAIWARPVPARGPLAPGPGAGAADARDDQGHEPHV